MNPGRPIIGAAQVVVVGVLIVVVYANFLRPGDDSTLSGVDAPGGPDVTQDAEPRADRNRGPGADDAEADDAGAGVQAAPSVATPTDVGPIAGPAPSGLAPPSGTPDSAGTGPTDDQYLDAVARLTVKLY